ncbi:type II toxin-antitoxin system Phd/YefM family antitoxin [Xylocopilactobacillus apicola]|uniref:Antitoxin n=1 Tax=Xylocopilactobacillus apicola TaxID=2932184 RepID=A0AAU9D9S9_9LACO|nr:type II toxin-antitoxin system Phd/YefM family antitoxin [Xylocopilactobacillus apicola]BDR57572.1 antitoxin [Xylocopilactobacillus apicola]
MDAVSYSNFRYKLKYYFKKVNEDAEPLVVTNKDENDDVVVMSKRDYDAFMETFRTLSNPYLLDKIKRGDEQFKSGKFQNHELIDFEDYD